MIFTGWVGESVDVEMFKHLWEASDVFSRGEPLPDVGEPLANFFRRYPDLFTEVAGLDPPHFSPVITVGENDLLYDLCRRQRDLPYLHPGH